MNLFAQIRKLVTDFFKATKNDEINIEDAGLELAEQKLKLQNALTQLYYQQGKLTDGRAKFQKEANDLTSDLELAVKSGRDDLSLHLLEKIDELKEQVTFIDAQLEQINKDVILAQETQKELELGSVKFKSSIEAFQTRKNLLESQKAIKEQLGSIRGDITQNVVSKLGEKVHLLNAQIKALESSNPLETDLQKLRKENHLNSRKQRLEKLKQKHFSRDIAVAR